MLLMLSGAGDELQGIKRGIMEMADGILITKADEGNEESAKRAKRTYENALHLFRAKESGWKPKVAPISSLKRRDLDLPLQWWESYFAHVQETGYFEAKRKNQELQFFEESFQYQMGQFIAEDPQIRNKYTELQQRITHGTCSFYEAANELLNLILNHGKL
jgi:LAO/AO transport system kinase